MSLGLDPDCRWSPRAIRDSADSGSPCEPGGDAAPAGRRAASQRLVQARPAGRRGTVRKPISAARPMLRTIERPTKQTCRPCAAAASSTCCTRCTWLAKQATMIRCGRAGGTRRRAPGRSRRSAITKPGTSALVESTRNRSTPSSPSRENPARSVSRPSSGSWSSLMSPVCSTRPAGRADGDRQRVRDGVVDREELAVERAVPQPRCPRLTSSRCGVSRCSLHLAATSASVNREPTTGRSGRCRSRNGTAPMWSSWPWVSTIASMSSRRSSMARKSGRIRSTPGRVLGGEQHPAVDDEQPAVVLEDGHVAADLADAAERDDPQAALGQVGRRRGGQLRAVHLLRRQRWGACCSRRRRRRSERSGRDKLSAILQLGRVTGRPAAARSAAIARIWASSAGGRGRRGSPTSRPRRRSAALAKTDAADPVHGPRHRQQRGVDARGPWRGRPPRTPSSIARRRSATTCPMTLTKPDRADRRATAGSAGRRPSSRRGRWWRSPSRPCGRSPLASLTATIRGCSASRSRVSSSIGTTLRGGMS